MEPSPSEARHAGWIIHESSTCKTTDNTFPHPSPHGLLPLTFKRMNKAIGHDVPELRIPHLRCDNKMLLWRSQSNIPDWTRPRDGHCSYLWGKRHRKPSCHGNEERHSVTVTPGSCRTDSDAQQGVVVLVVLVDRTQPWNQLMELELELR